MATETEEMENILITAYKPNMNVRFLSPSLRGEHRERALAGGGK
ncbi:hypothetical protein ACFOG5_15410 [Pedobacter fastidiosus]